MKFSVEIEINEDEFKDIDKKGIVSYDIESIIEDWEYNGGLADIFEHIVLAVEDKMEKENEDVWV